MTDKSRRDMKQRVVVSGLGMVTPLGVGKDEFCHRLFSGERGIGEIKSFDTKDFTSHLGAEVTNFSPRDFISVKNLRRMDKISPMAVVASRLALEDAKIKVTEENRDRIGIILGTAFGATDVT
ncbi:MAG TPA: beta-ketoacyl-[acyl-carrier-protein] synthase II, partial [Deltaproteobacteria bacterium]|nr:beta-ketoacyl-[acyl-carrier-protein] synthase II [Deltaproteobacteria bacterium]